MEGNLLWPLLVSISTVIAFLAILFLTFFVYARNRQNQLVKEQWSMKKEFDTILAQSSIEVQEYAYTSVGQDLHDNVGQLLSSAKLLLMMAEKEIGTVPDAFVTANNTLQQAINEIRTMSKTLSREWLTRFDLIENLITEKERISHSRQLDMLLRIDTKKIELNSQQQILVFRIIQEAVQNCIKHAEASSLLIHLFEKNELLSCIIRDNGKGFFPLKSNQPGMGLHNMQQRIHALNGEINIESKPGSGTQITLQIPFSLKES